MRLLRLGALVTLLLSMLVPGVMPPLSGRAASCSSTANLPVIESGYITARGATSCTAGGNRTLRVELHRQDGTLLTWVTGTFYGTSMSRYTSCNQYGSSGYGYYTKSLVYESGNLISSATSGSKTLIGYC